MIGRESLFRRRNAGARGPHGGVRRTARRVGVFQFFFAHGTARHQRFARRVIVFSFFNIGQQARVFGGFHRHIRRQGIVVGEPSPYFAHRAREFCIGGIERDLRIRCIEFDQQLTRINMFGFTHIDRAHGTGDLRCHFDHVGGYISVFGLLIEARHLPIVKPAPDAAHQHQ